MKLARYGDPGRERPAVLSGDDTLVDVSAHVHDYDERFFAEGGIERLRALVDGGGLDGLPTIAAGDVRIGAPIARPEKIVCIGLNYADHAEEAGFPIPREPTVFFKAPNTIVGPNDEVAIPPGAERVDWEVELAVVIGERCRYLPDEAAAQRAIAGFAIANDFSERAYQLERGGEWAKGKSCETFNPLGPYLATPDEIADVQQLDMWLTVNDEPMQRSSTANMLFSAAHVVWYLSQFMVLEPGNLIDTGTPGGVGNLQRPPRFLSPGDVVELGIDGLGTQRLTMAAARV